MNTTLLCMVAAAAVGTAACKRSTPAQIEPNSTIVPELPAQQPAAEGWAADEMPPPPPDEQLDDERELPDVPPVTEDESDVPPDSHDEGDAPPDSEDE